jgi:hypothetical protein
LKPVPKIQISAVLVSGRNYPAKGSRSKSIRLRQIEWFAKLVLTLFLVWDLVTMLFLVCDLVTMLFLVYDLVTMRGGLACNLLARLRVMIVIGAGGALSTRQGRSWRARMGMTTLTIPAIINKGRCDSTSNVITALGLSRIQVPQLYKF